MPGKTYFGYVSCLLVILLATWMIYGWVKGTLPLRSILFGCAAMTVTIIWLLVQPPLSFEGTSNHDDLWYIFNAEYLLTYGRFGELLAEPTLAELGAQSSLSSLPRFGADSIVAFVSFVFGLPTYSAYPVANSLIYALLISVIAGSAVQTRFVISKFWPVPLLLGLLPIVSLTYWNNNYANLIGLLFLSGFHAVLYRLVSGKLAMATGVIHSSILLSALVLTYPELLSMALPMSFLTVMSASQNGKLLDLNWNQVGIVLKIFLVSAVITLYAAGDTIRIATSVSQAVEVASQAPEGWASLLRGLVETLSLLIIGKSILGIGLFASALVIFLMVFLLSVNFPKAALRMLLPAILPPLGIIFYSAWRGYEYGFLKSAEYAAYGFALAFGLALVEFLNLRGLNLNLIRKR